ncbi:SWI/SNF complex subunit SMARCC2 [Yarrowia sp. C11]|nr:SWI/SNF complex subunit SMARCC2 [Yarrowia sp. C11]KAG5364310.1 SWI/SNF complex subunit SMARCC2 [Yarrowia sp. E02]
MFSEEDFGAGGNADAPNGTPTSADGISSAPVASTDQVSAANDMTTASTTEPSTATTATSNTDATAESMDVAAPVIAADVAGADVPVGTDDIAAVAPETAVNDIAGGTAGDIPVETTTTVTTVTEEPVTDTAGDTAVVTETTETVSAETATNGSDANGSSEVKPETAAVATSPAPALPSDGMDMDYMPADQDDKEDDWNMDLEPEWEATGGIAENAETKGSAEPKDDKDADTEMLDADTAIPDDQKLKETKPVVAPPPVPRNAVPDYIPQAHTIVIPSYASWFNVNRIHSIEKKSIPEFFNQRNNSKTPEVYKRYRAFMINTYRLHPTEYLTVTAVRRNLLGDVCAIMRVHQFLEKWGLINYQVDIEARPQMVAPPFTGHWEVTEDMPRGLFPFQAYKGTRFLKRAGENGSPDDADAIEAKKAKVEGDDESTNDKDTGKEGTEGAADGDTDSVRVKTEPTTPQVEPFVQSDPEWTKREVYHLLNGIEEHGNDWTAISEVVGNKTREQCLLKFISLSTEDKYLDKNGDVSASPSGQDIKVSPLKVSPKYLPFDHVDNPVLSVVSFLAGLVDPAVVSAMTGRGVEQIRKTLNLEMTEQKKQQLLERKRKREQEKKDKEAAAAKDGESKDGENKDGEGDKEGDKDSVKEEEDEDPALYPPGASDSTDAGASIKDVPLETLTSLGYSTLGTKAQVFADFSEKEMYRDMFELTKAQATKMEMKMEKFAELERIIEMERRQLQMEREQVFLQRLLLNKKVSQVDNLLTQAAEETKNQQLIDQARSIVRGATKLSFAPTVQDQALENSCVENSLDNVTPVTEKKQTFTFWQA